MHEREVKKGKLQEIQHLMELFFEKQNEERERCEEKEHERMKKKTVHINLQKKTG